MFFTGRQLCDYIVNKTRANVFTLCDIKLLKLIHPSDDKPHTVFGHHETFVPSPVVQFLRNDRSTLNRRIFINRFRSGSGDKNEYTIDNVVKQLSVMNTEEEKIHQVCLF